MGKRFLIFETGTKVDSPFAKPAQNMLGQGAKLELKDKSEFLNLNLFGFKKK